MPIICNLPRVLLALSFPDDLNARQPLASVISVALPLCHVQPGPLSGLALDGLSQWFVTKTMPYRSDAGERAPHGLLSRATEGRVSASTPHCGWQACLGPHHGGNPCGVSPANRSSSRGSQSAMRRRAKRLITPAASSRFNCRLTVSRRKPR